MADQTKNSNIAELSHEPRLSAMLGGASALWCGRKGKQFEFDCDMERTEGFVGL